MTYLTVYRHVVLAIICKPSLSQGDAFGADWGGRNYKKPIRKEILYHWNMKNFLSGATLLPHAPRSKDLG
jgi:hypothetical protein